MRASSFVTHFIALTRKETRQMLPRSQQSDCRATVARGPDPAVRLWPFLRREECPINGGLEDSSPTAREALAGLRGSP
jgi:hypothetical protein